MLSIECVMRSRNSSKARHSIEWRAFYRTRKYGVYAEYSRGVCCASDSYQSSVSKVL